MLKVFVQCVKFYSLILVYEFVYCSTNPVGILQHCQINPKELVICEASCFAKFRILEWPSCALDMLKSSIQNLSCEQIFTFFMYLYCTSLLWFKCCTRVFLHMIENWHFKSQFKLMKVWNLLRCWYLQWKLSRVHSLGQTCNVAYPHSNKNSIRLQLKSCKFHREEHTFE